MEALKRLLRGESGLETVEAAFILGFVILGVVVAYISGRLYLRTIFNEMINKLSDAARGVSGGP